MTAEHSAPLAMMHAGQRVSVVEIHGGPGFVRRMQEMGFVKGEKILLLNAGHPGPVRVKIKGSTVAIGHGLARKIMVA